MLKMNLYILGIKRMKGDKTMVVKKTVEPPTTGELTLQDESGLYRCSRCGGERKIDGFRCMHCWGKGTLDWIENILGCRDRPRVVELFNQYVSDPTFIDPELLEALQDILEEDDVAYSYPRPILEQAIQFIMDDVLALPYNDDAMGSLLDKGLVSQDFSMQYEVTHERWCLNYYGSPKPDWFQDIIHNYREAKSDCDKEEILYNFSYGIRRFVLDFLYLLEPNPRIDEPFKLARDREAQIKPSEGWFQEDIEDVPYAERTQSES